MQKSKDIFEILIFRICFLFIYIYIEYIHAFRYELKQVLHIMEPGCGLATPG